MQGGTHGLQGCESYLLMLLSFISIWITFAIITLLIQLLPNAGQSLSRVSSGLISLFRPVLLAMLTLALMGIVLG